MNETQKLYLEDLYIGMEFQSKAHQIDSEQIIDFAEKFDPQIFHLDDIEAQKTLFGGLAASGWHTAAITMKLLVQSFPLGSGIIGAGGEIKWPIPTRPNDTLKVLSTVLAVHPSKSKMDRGIITLESKTINQFEKTCQVLVTQLVVMRRS